MTKKFTKRDPYAIKRLGGDNWVVLNRYYKPLSVKDYRTRIDYGPYAERLYGLDEEQQRLMSWNGTTADEHKDKLLWLYNDGCTPWSSVENAAIYRARLKMLTAARQ